MLDTLGQYKILDRIGAGGMGEVYRARDTRLGRTVALKVPPADVADDPDRRERFLREARATAALSHPNIAALYEIGEEQGQIFLVFEFVPGETLKNAIAGRPMNPRRAIDLSVQIADALAEAHTEGIIHRDIKPSNIMVTPKGAAKVLDFGLATWTAGGVERETAQTMLATSPGTTLGTIAYMSPEQALGEAVDQRTDIFSLGVVLFEMLTGKLPFAGATSTAMALQIVQSAAPAPGTINRSLPKELDAVVGRALAKSIDGRYESAATFAAELRAVSAILDVRSSASEPASRAATLMLRRRRSASPWIAILAVLMTLAAAGWWQRAAIAHAWHRSVSAAPAPVIAVIPLELAGSDASQQFFADGLTEDLITRLGQTPGLKVLGRSATRAYRDRTPRDVASELGAAVVLTGSVRPAADQIRITLELIDPSDGLQVWTSQYTRDIKDIFAVQEQVAGEVAQALRVKLQPSAASERTAARLVNRRAYELYLRGRQATAERKVPEAIGLYEQAIAADAGLSEAFAGLAEALHLETAFDAKPDDVAHRQRRKEVAARAYQLDPDLPQANLAMGLSADTLAQALGFMRRAVEIDPSFAEAFHQIADQIADVDPDLAIRFYRRSLEIDPRLDMSRLNISEAYLLLDRPEDGQKELDTLAASDPSGSAKPVRDSWRLLFDVYRHRFDRALPEMAAAPWIQTREPLRRWYVRALRTAGRRDEALQEGTRMLEQWPASCEGRAIVAGLRLEHGQSAAAHQLADPILRAAQAVAPFPADLRCGATAAAAMDDASGLTFMLDRIASDEQYLRYWTLEIFGETGGAVMQGLVYPFVEIVDKPALAGARQHLAAAYARQRAVAQSALAGVL